MTHQADVARGREIVARWCELAEQRLEYLSELFETGRWRRFYSESSFLENIREAKAAVEAWKVLVTREASLDNSAVDMSWLGHRGVSSPRSDTTRHQVRSLPPRPVRIPEQPLRRDFPMVATSRVYPDEAPSVPDTEAPMLTIEQRYPLLRNAL